MDSTGTGKTVTSIGVLFSVMVVTSLQQKPSRDAKRDIALYPVLTIFVLGFYITLRTILFLSITYRFLGFFQPTIFLLDAFLGLILISNSK
ncbi:hypothetical protein X975_05466, partial [Stegodyphus mimosarum]